MTDVLYPDGKAHETSKRVSIEEVAKDHEAREVWFGIEQEYTFPRGRSPLG